MQSLIRSKSAGVTGGRGTAGAGPGRDLLYSPPATPAAPSARNGEVKTQQRGATQRPRHPHYRTATTGTNPQHTTVTNATDS